MAKNARPSVDNYSYEKALLELEEVVNKLETESPDLEESLALFERGRDLAQHCSDLLEKAELKVKQLDLTDNVEEGV